MEKLDFVSKQRIKFLEWKIEYFLFHKIIVIITLHWYVKFEFLLVGKFYV